MGKITGDDDGNGIKDGAIDVASGGEDDVVEFVFLAMAKAELAVDVFDHDDGAVNDDAEVDGADGEEIGGFAGRVQKDEGEEKSERNGERGDDGGAEADQEKDQDDQDEDHAAQEIPFDGVRGDANEVAAVVVGTNFHVGREKRLVDLLGFFLDAFEDILRLLAAAHQDDAFDGVVVLFLLCLEAENAEARSVADYHAADVLDADGHAIQSCRRRLRRCLRCF